MININRFVEKHVTRRESSMFRDDIKLNEIQLSEQIRGKSVLVIGGAGTIGSSFIKALLPFEPSKLIVVDINENGLTELTRDLRSAEGVFVPEQYITYPMSYASPVFYKMFNANGGFDIVANFSAHKHVRSEKDRFSIEALLNNNIIYAQKLLDTLNIHKPKHFFCVSTDKAANPVNIMGASKKIMEDMIMSYSKDYPITTARFANVAFSNGSLPAGFLDRISKNQPISAPKDVTRYFVSPEESGQICLLACVIGNSGEIFFPKLRKEQVMTFSEIATNLLHEYGFDVDECNSEKEALNKSRQELKNKYPVYYSNSSTSGEKPYEEFYTDNEAVDLERHRSLGVVTNIQPKSIDEISNLLSTLIDLLDKEKVEKSDIVMVMKDFLGNFDHKETGKSLDSKM
jgi:FlaA1/EpsC-like NDP-sugar epimerase